MHTSVRLFPRKWMNQSILGIAYPKRPRYLMATVETTSIGPCKPDPKMMCQWCRCTESRRFWGRIRILNRHWQKVSLFETMEMEACIHRNTDWFFSMQLQFMSSFPKIEVSTLYPSSTVTFIAVQQEGLEVTRRQQRIQALRHENCVGVYFHQPLASHCFWQTLYLPLTRQIVRLEKRIKWMAYIILYETVIVQGEERRVLFCSDMLRYTGFECENSDYAWF